MFSRQRLKAEKERGVRGEGEGERERKGRRERKEGRQVWTRNEKDGRSLKANVAGP